MNTPAPFSQVLRAECQKDWQAAIQHRFVDEIFAGTLSSEHLRHYLVQDYQFVDRFVALLGAAIASADQYAARVRFSQFAAMITSDENTYFQRCFDLLRVPPHRAHHTHTGRRHPAVPGADARGSRNPSLCQRTGRAVRG